MSVLLRCRLGGWVGNETWDGQPMFTTDASKARHFDTAASADQYMRNAGDVPVSMALLCAVDSGDSEIIVR